VIVSSAQLLWPLAGRDGRDWVINNYVDLDSTTGTLDYTGGSGTGAKTYNGHSGIDIDVPNFRWMDGGLSIVVAAASGVVTSVHDNEPDRNTSCTGNANLVQVRHADGLTALYGHLRRGSVAVSVGQQVSVGAVLGVVGSSGCSTAPHLHFELRDAANRVVDPFRNGLWAAPPIYNAVVTLMDLVIASGDMTLQQIKDPAPNVKSIPRGSVLGVGVSMAGGGAGDVIRLVITAPTGATFSDNPLTFTKYSEGPGPMVTRTRIVALLYMSPTTRGRRIALEVLLWIFAAMLILVFVPAGWDKFDPSSGWARAFAFWHYPVWFRLLIGALEIAAAVLLLWPRTAAYGAAIIVVVMAGGMGTHVLIEHRPSRATSELLQFIFASIVLAGRWRTRISLWAL